MSTIKIGSIVIPPECLVEILNPHKGVIDLVIDSSRKQGKDVDLRLKRAGKKTVMEYLLAYEGGGEAGKARLVELERDKKKRNVTYRLEIVDG